MPETTEETGRGDSQASPRTSRSRRLPRGRNPRPGEGDGPGAVQAESRTGGAEALTHVFHIGYDVADSARRDTLRNAITSLDGEGTMVVDALESGYFVFTKSRNINAVVLKEYLQAFLDGRFDSLVVCRVQEILLFGSRASRKLRRLQNLD